MKILQISSAPVQFLGGTEKVVLEISKNLSKKNKVTILQTDLYMEKENIPKIMNIGKIKVITCRNKYFLGGYGYSKEFKDTLKRIYSDYDIVHIHGYGRFTTDYSMKFLKNKKPFIFTAEGFFHTKKHYFFKKIHDFFYKNRLKNPRFCIALTEDEIKKFIKLGVRKNKIIVIPAGINREDYKNKNIQRLKEKYLGKKKNRKTILYVGRIHKSKGIQEVFKAIRDIDVNFLIIGKDAGYKKELEKKEKELGIEEKVRFFGAVDKKTLLEVYALSDLFVLYSEWEGFGIVLIEAMASGLPCIVSNKGSLPYLIKDNYNGFIADNLEQLREKIKVLTQNEKLRKKLGINAKKFSKRFDWHKISEEHSRLYKRVLKEYE